MKEDENGFLYPEINQRLCIDCGLCARACAFPAPSENPLPQSVYAAQMQDRGKLMESQSGGAFSAIATPLLLAGCNVYGAGMPDDLTVRHMRIERPEDLVHIKKSKYVQSDTCGAFASARDDLIAGRRVLFSGTPCQVDGLLHFMTAGKTDTQNLITVDFVCHGVPSPMVYRDFIHSIERRKHKKIGKFCFRDKRFGWHDHVETYSFQDAPDKWIRSNVYTKIFYKCVAFRPSCFCCPYSNRRRCSDLTVADYWGVGDFFPEIRQPEGVSLVLVNTPKGAGAFSRAEGLQAWPSNIEDAGKYQRRLSMPNPKPEKYDDFWRDYHKLGGSRTIRKYGGVTGLNRVRRRLRVLKSKLGRQ